MFVRRKVRHLRDVVEWGMCVGCGACVAAAKPGAIRMEDVPDAGLRPRFVDPAAAVDPALLAVCPGYTVDAAAFHGLDGDPADDASRQLGPFLELWEGHAADPDIRHHASSGGLLTALALHCLEREGMAFVLHSGMDAADPLRNRTVLSRTREELLARTGSRYAPASPCEGLAEIERADRPCVFIGKPCDATAAHLARRQRPELDRNLGLVLTFFCAGTPSTRGTLDLLARLNVRPEEVRSIRYRGRGWPGRFTVEAKDGRSVPSLSYEEAWGHLTSYRPFRCHLCPDGLGRIADLSCGDAWHDYARDGNEGLSIVIVRTERGREVLRRARESGAVVLRPVAPDDVIRAQVNLLGRRVVIHGRLLAMRWFGIPTPRFEGYALREDWRRQPAAVRLRSVASTVKRIVLRGWWRRRVAVEPSRSVRAEGGRTP